MQYPAQPRSLNLRRFALRAATATVAIALFSGSVGCSSNPSQKEKAKIHWNAARGQVQAKLAEDQLAAGQLDEARRTCDQALAITNRLPEIFLLSARIDIERNELPAALAALKYARQLQPPAQLAASVEHLSGVVAERWEETDKAVVHHGLATTLNPNEPTYLLAYAEALVSAGRADEAATELESRVTYFEGNAAIRDGLGQVYQAQGRHAEAAEMFRRASILVPDDLDVRERLAFATLQSGDTSRAAVLIEKLLTAPEMETRLSLHTALGECRLARGEHALARVSFQRAARLDSRHVPAWLGVAKASIEGGDLSRADQALERAFELAPESADVRLLRGYLRLKQDRISEAADDFVAAAEANPNDPMAQLLYGQCLQKLGRTGEAAAYYRRAQRLDPTDPLADELLAAIQGGDAVAGSDTKPID